MIAILPSRRPVCLLFGGGALARRLRAIPDDPRHVLGAPGSSHTPAAVSSGRAPRPLADWSITTASRRTGHRGRCPPRPPSPSPRHRARADDVGADVVAAVLERHGLGHADHRVLRGRVRRERRRRVPGEVRAGRDDRAAAGDQVRQRVLHSRPCAARMDAHHLVVGLVGDVGQRVDSPVPTPAIANSASAAEALDRPLLCSSRPPIAETMSPVAVTSSADRPHSAVSRSRGLRASTPLQAR
jgi:hypothetical protein